MRSGARDGEVGYGRVDPGTCRVGIRRRVGGDCGGG